MPVPVPVILNRHLKCRCRCRLRSAGAGAGAGNTQPALQVPVPVLVPVYKTGTPSQVSSDNFEFSLVPRVQGPRKIKYGIPFDFIRWYRRWLVKCVILKLVNTSMCKNVSQGAPPFVGIFFFLFFFGGGGGREKQKLYENILEILC